jgi:hypothetical protein
LERVVTPYVCSRCGGFDNHCLLCVARHLARKHGGKDDPAGGDERSSREGSPTGLIVRDTTDTFGGKP